MVALLTADAPSLFSAFGPPQWGIFTQGGAPILTVDSVASVEYARDYHISDFPQEKGAFASYNKVQVPFQAKVSFLIGPSRIEFLNAVEAAVASLKFVSVVTPEISYPSANLTHYSYRREVRNGVTLIRVDIWAEEVRVISGTSVASTPTGTTGGGITASGTASGGVGTGGGGADVPSGISVGATQSTNAATPTQSGQVQPVDSGARVDIGAVEIGEPS